MGLYGGNILWNPGQSYLVGAHVSGQGTSVPDNGEYFYSESATFASPSHPWFICFNDTSNTNTPTLVYDGYPGVEAWTGNSAVVSARTVTFAYGEQLGSSALYSEFPLLYQQDFIRYVVDNSDFRSRYTLTSGSWSPASYSYSDPVLSWQVPSGNSNYNLTIYHGATTSDWTQVAQRMGQSGNGSLTISESGYYRLDFTYVVNGEPQSQTITTSYLVVAGTTPIVLDHMESGFSGNAEYYIFVWFDDPQPNTVVLQIMSNGIWEDVANLGYDTSTGNAHSGAWWYQHNIKSGTYRVVAYNSTDSLVINLGHLSPISDNDWSVFGDLLPYINDFFNYMHSLWTWLPETISDFLLLAIMAMIILGVIQLVKP